MNDKDFKFKTDEGYKYKVENHVLPPVFKRAAGICYDPKSENPLIIIDPTLSPRRELSVSIEEFAHAFFFEKTEKKVRKFSATLAKYLYSRGWRKVL